MFMTPDFAINTIISENKRRGRKETKNKNKQKTKQKQKATKRNNEKPVERERGKNGRKNNQTVIKDLAVCFVYK